MKTRSLVSAIVVLGVVVFAHTIQSQEKSVPQPNQSFSGTIVEQTEETRTSDLKQTYLELINAQAALMDEATLQEEIKVTQRNIDELQAVQQLNEARRLLLAITADYPETEAATHATSMLDAVESPKPQAEFDDIGPALNAKAGLPFTRSSFQRPAQPQGKQQKRTPARSRL